MKAQQERARTLLELADISTFYYRDFENYDDKAAKKALKPEAVEPLERCRDLMGDLDDWSREALHGMVKSVVSELEVGFGKVAMPLRVAVTGGAK